ncbi:C2H2-type zinc finger protein [Kocuria palustris]|nr:C2H2-type zinc finger protein [Kocuria palustris]
MEYNHWDIEAPFELEDMLNQTLTGLQDLDVPLGFEPDSAYHNPSTGTRKILGTAIFGVTAPSDVADLYCEEAAKLGVPVALQQMLPGDEILNFDLDDDKQFFSSPLKKEDWDADYNDFSKHNKYPPLLPIPTRAFQLLPIKKDTLFTTNFLVKYLQELHNRELPVYVDDIEPLLDKKYVPIPVQEPTPINLQFLDNAFLPPPAESHLVHLLPQWLSPEPTSPLPQRLVYLSNLTLSPVHPVLKNSTQFCNPQYFDPHGSPEHDVAFSTPQKPPPPVFMAQLESIPLPRHSQESFGLSPIKNQLPVRSPARPQPLQQAEVVDADATITQLTPLKQNPFPNTPVKGSLVQLEWSPIILPNPKGNENVRKHIQQLTPKRIKKTLLLPPGELDRYWEGPDENKTYTCTYRECGKKFTRRYNVRSHIQTHLCDRPFACTYCTKKFVRQHDLNRHVKGHLEARHCKCPCGKEFARLDALKKHRERNICAGGLAPQPAAISKPLVRVKHKVLDEAMSEKVIDNILGRDQPVGHDGSN